MPVPTEKFVERFCSIPLAGLLSSLSYNLILVLMCTFYAFKTRRLPDNFNESRYVAFCVDTTLLIWITFLPTYFTTARAYYKVTILASALLLNATVTLICLFLPKLYKLYEQVRGTPTKKTGNCNVFRVVKSNNSRSCVTEMSSVTQPLRSSSGDNSSVECGNGLGCPYPSAASFRSVDTLQTSDVKFTLGKIP